MSDIKKYEEIFEYLSAPLAPHSPESTVVFGRKDRLVAQAAGKLIMEKLVPVAVITGGIGKDSGNLLELGYSSEADYLHRELKQDAITRNYSLDAVTVYLDEQASNGGENARNSIGILNGANHSTDTLTAVAHATSARRLAEMLKSEGEKINGTAPNVFVQPTAYPFDARDISDQAEARAELLRLADWPVKGWLLAQHDLPDDLVEFARDESL
jgi:hypothetical protein